MAKAIPIGPVLICLAAPLVAQDDPAVARYRVADRAAAVTRSELAVEVAGRNRRSGGGQEALRLLVDRVLVTDAATRSGLSASAAEVVERIAEIERTLAAQGRDLDSFLEQKGVARADFERDYVALSIAHERLVMESVELRDPGEITPEMLELWLKEARVKVAVVDDPAELPDGIVARVGETELGLLDLGAVLLQSLTDDERHKHVRRIVLRHLLEHHAREAGIEVRAEDTRAEIERRKQRVESDPRFGGVGYEAWLLQTQGMTVDELARSPHMVATVQQQKLVDFRHPREDLERRLREDRAGVLRRHGEKRELSLLLLRATEAPNELLPRTYDEAGEQIATLRARLAEGMPFDRAARLYSEDPYSKAKGGAIGAFFRGSTELPEPVLEAAFALRPGEVSAPIRVPQGVLLVQVTEIEPPPDEDELRRRLRDELASQLLLDLLEAAELEMLDR